MCRACRACAVWGQTPDHTADSAAHLQSLGARSSLAGVSPFRRPIAPPPARSEPQGAFFASVCELCFGVAKTMPSAQSIAFRTVGMSSSCTHRSPAGAAGKGQQAVHGAAPEVGCRYGPDWSTRRGKRGANSRSVCLSCSSEPGAMA